MEQTILEKKCISLLSSLFFPLTSFPLHFFIPLSLPPSFPPSLLPCLLPYLRRNYSASQEILLMVCNFTSWIPSQNIVQTQTYLKLHSHVITQDTPVWWARVFIMVGERICKCNCGLESVVCWFNNQLFHGVFADTKSEQGKTFIANVCQILWCK